MREIRTRRVAPGARAVCAGRVLRKLLGAPPHLRHFGCAPGIPNDYPVWFRWAVRLGSDEGPGQGSNVTLWRISAPRRRPTTGPQSNSSVAVAHKVSNPEQ